MKNEQSILNRELIKIDYQKNIDDVLAEHSTLNWSQMDSSQEYNARYSAAVKLVTIASQCRKIGTRVRKRKGGGALNLRIASFAGNSEWQSSKVLSCLILTNEFLSQAKLLAPDYGGQVKRLAPTCTQPARRAWYPGPSTSYRND
ncbi:hypothetical protein EVAR_19821_1 [Eumeta japonica]|uniref:Uncharacterized protein n=1 Tax=Eumeta variegata TaxID=151549 RepID=A0A4C1UR31_EUMVA|nr:hypothetical protein EVAR_19821_1 [Eumeta japonica]